MNIETYRHEIKYHISANEAKWALSLLGNWMEKDINTDGEGKYKVRSLYFDDLAKTAYYEKEEGFYYRKKYRARIYLKSEFSEKIPVKLECKRRSGQKISKKVSLIPHSEFARISHGKSPAVILEGVLDDFALDNANCKLYPGIIVDYDRYALVDKFYSLRITFDWNLSAGWDVDSFFSENLLTVPVFNTDEVILEIKYRDFIPEHIITVLKNTRMQQQSFSKFFMCMNNNYRQVIKELL